LFLCAFWVLLVGCVHRRECIQKWHGQECLVGGLGVHFGCCWLAACIGGNAFRSGMAKSAWLVVCACILGVAGWLRS